MKDNERLEAALDDYASGNLSPVRHAIISAQRKIDARIDDEVTCLEDLHAKGISQAEGVELSNDFFAGMTAKLSNLEGLKDEDFQNNHLESRASDYQSEATRLAALAPDYLMSLDWKRLVPGVYIHDVLGDRHSKTGERLYLLRVKAGMKLSEHSHVGQEWTLILKGAYSANGKTYKRGDVHISDDSEVHTPQIHEGEDCICLAAVDGHLVMKSWLPRLLQPLIGV